MDWLNEIEAFDWKALLLTWGGKLLVAALILVIGLQVAKWITNLIQRLLERADVEPIATLFLRKVAYIVLLVIVALAVLQFAFGVLPTSMLPILGAAGLAIGLALKDSLSNVASGVMLVSLKPFRVGDVVTINGETGKVMSVSIFQTKLRGADNQTIVLPNSLITSDSIINLTPDTMRRIELVIGIGYTDDIQKARGVALDVMTGDSRVLKDPPPDVLVYALADSSVNLGIRCHVENADYFVTKCELTEGIKIAFDDAGISIPFPQRDMHMFTHMLPAAAAGSVAQLPKPAEEAKPGSDVARQSGGNSEKVGVGSNEHKPQADPE